MERSPKLSGRAVDFGTNSTYLHANMPKINSSSVKICESSRPRLARVSPASRPRLAQKFSIVTRAVVYPTGVSFNEDGVQQYCRGRGFRFACE